MLLDPFFGTSAPVKSQASILTSTYIWQGICPEVEEHLQVCPGMEAAVSSQLSMDQHSGRNKNQNECASTQLGHLNKGLS